MDEKPVEEKLSERMRDAFVHAEFFADEVAELEARLVDARVNIDDLRRQLKELHEGAGRW